MIHLSCHRQLTTLYSSLGENSVVVVISGANSTTQGLTEAVSELHRLSVPLYLVAWPSLAPAYLPLAKLGRAYSVLEGETVPEPRLQLQEILLDVLSRSEGRPIRRLHLETHQGLAFSGAFSFQGEEEAELRVTLNIHEEDRVEFFEVRDPDGMQRLFSKWEDGMVFLHFSGRLPVGLWTYRAKLYPKIQIEGDEEEEGEVWVDVVCSRREDREGLRAELLTSAGPLVTDPLTQPLRVYARLTSISGHPVTGAVASILLLGPGEEKQELELRDDGLGYPDITQGDGLYSTYIPSFSSLPGYYSLRLVVFDSREGAFIQTAAVSPDCCGSSVNSLPNPASPLPPFSLVVPGPALYLSSGYEGDVAPPSRISDLSITSHDPTNLEVVLEWTAPGEDWDHGTAASYEIRCHTVRDSLSQTKFNHQGITVPVQLVPVPLPQGSRQSARVSVPWANEAFYFGVVAVDEAGHRGDVSNLVSVLVVEEPSTMAPMEEVREVEEATREEVDTSPGLYIAGGILSGLMVVILTILLVLMFRRRRKRCMVTASSTTDDPNFPVSDIKIQKHLADSPPLVHTTLRKVAGTPPSLQTYEHHLENYDDTQTNFASSYDYQSSSSMHSPADFGSILHNSTQDYLPTPATPHLSYGAGPYQTPPSIHSQGVLLSQPLSPPSPRVLLSWLGTLEQPTR